LGPWMIIIISIQLVNWLLKILITHCIIIHCFTLPSHMNSRYSQLYSRIFLLPRSLFSQFQSLNTFL
jgi:hypothetical protein